MKEQSDLNVTLNLLDYNVFTGDLSEVNPTRQTEQLVINTINQYSYCIAEKDADFKKALQNSDILLPDGIAIVLAAKILKNKRIKKIAGADVHQYLLEKLNSTNGSCFYMGSKESTLEKIKKRLSVEYPNIKIHTYSPPFKNEFDEEDNSKIINAINTFSPDVLFVGMTAPKQEKWVNQHKDKLDTKVICSIGAVFDFYGGTIERPHQIWINLGLEWFARLIKEPKRMWKRYLYYGPIFIFAIIKRK